MILSRLYQGILFVTGVCALLVGGQARAASFHAIICGSGGEAAYEERFAAWGTGLRDVLLQQLGNEPGKVYLLTEALETGPRTDPATLEGIRKLFATLAESVGPEDDLYIYIIGHGTYIKRQLRLLLPGPDLTAEVLKELLDAVPAKRRIVLNSTASSAGFVNVLSGPDTVICTATKSVDEFNATEFMEFFIEGLREGGADRNYDERISFLEACEYAAEVTATWFLGEGLIATEHSIIDDNGDGLGSRLPILDAVEDAFAPGRSTSPAIQNAIFDGSLASECFLKEFTFPPNVPSDLIDEYLGTLEEVAVLKKEKADLSGEEYFQRLESLFLRAASANARIHELMAVATDAS